jgi:hypothetical protein
MISGPLAHVGGLPIEETLGAFGPALLAGLAVTWARCLAAWRASRSPGRQRQRVGADGPRVFAHVGRDEGASPSRVLVAGTHERTTDVMVHLTSSVEVERQDPERCVNGVRVVAVNGTGREVP